MENIRYNSIAVSLYTLGVKQYIEISIYIAIFTTAIQYNMANREY